MSVVHRPLDPVLAERSAMRAFARAAEPVAGRRFDDYPSLHRWACDHVGPFWTAFVAWSGVRWSGSIEPAVVGEGVEGSRFFPSLKLNYTRTLLGPVADDTAPAIVACTEDGGRTELSRAELRRRALGIAQALRARGVRAGDRVVAVAANTPDAIEACLGATAIGATWSSVAPDLGDEAVLARFRQLDPVVLCVQGVHRHHGVVRDLGARIAALAAGLPSVRHVLVLGDGAVPRLPDGVEGTLLAAWRGVDAMPLDALEDHPFDHPLFVLFSSGTTGPPKCIVHGAGGTLLEHLKELGLHTGLGPADRLLFQTSCGWMMWNWQLASLALGTCLVLYEGSPSYPDPAALLRVLDRERVTVFGTSPAYLQMLRDAGVVPGAAGAFEALRAVESTGSILRDAQFDWIRDHLKDVAVDSISGGTDIIGCFVLGNPWLPILRGESPGPSLGLDVRVVTDGGLERVGTGELVCANPFPSRPVRIWGDADGSRLHDSYYAQHTGVWTHGDRVTLSEGGSARILGRSDGTMKIRGVRIGPAEICSIVLDAPGIVDAMAVEQHDPREPGGARIVLLVVAAPGVVVDRPMTLRLKKAIAERASPVHVPAVVAQVPDLPRTLNGKLSERAARDVVNGRDPPNRAALRDPGVLDALRAHPLLQPPS